MKNLLSVMLCIAFLGLTAVPALANSAPSYWKAYPYSEVLAVDEDWPIAVDSELLTFDFYENYEYGNNNSPVARVTASYMMTNPSEDALPVQMAFPFVASLSTLSVPDIDIRADGEIVPYEIYIDTHEVDTEGDSGEGFAYGGTCAFVYVRGKWAQSFIIPLSK